MDEGQPGSTKVNSFCEMSCPRPKEVINKGGGRVRSTCLNGKNLYLFYRLINETQES